MRSASRRRAATTAGVALSPDGQWIAYVASTDRAGLWIRRVDDRDGNVFERSLQKTEGAAYPFWSPDSKSLGFFADGKLKRIDVAGGDPSTICAVAIGRGGAWTDNDEIVFGALLSGLSKVLASGGGNPTPLTWLDTRRGETGHSWPQMLSGGRFIYWVRSDSGENEGVYAASLANPQVAILLKRGTDTNGVFARGGDGKDYLLWLTQGALWAQPFDETALKLIGEVRQIAFPVSMIGLFGRANLAIPTKGLLVYAGFNTSSQFAWFSPDGTQSSAADTQIRYSGEPGQYTVFRISPQGGRVVAATDKPGGTDLKVDVQARTTILISDRGMNSYPVWSPDGRWILYTAGHLNLFLKPAEGATTAATPLTHSANAQYATDWSRDGRSILYWEVSPDKAKRQLWVLPINMKSAQISKSAALPYLTSDHNESWGRFSPEPSPQWVAYQSDATGHNEIYIDQFPKSTGGPIRLSLNGGQYPVWNPNGREIFYVSPDYKLMAVALQRDASTIVASRTREVFRLPAIDIGWPPYDIDPQTGNILVRASIADRPPKPLTLMVNWALPPKN